MRVCVMCFSVTISKGLSYHQTGAFSIDLFASGVHILSENLEQNTSKRDIFDKCIESEIV